MSLPKQPTAIDKDRRALAPYNFVELPEEIIRVVDSETPADTRRKMVDEALPNRDVFHVERHTGWIDCRMVTASPTYVRAALTLADIKGGKQSKDLPTFFYVWDKNQPVFPGTTLRGMLRSLVEIVSFGKLSEVSRSRLVYRAVGDTTSHGERYRELLMEEQGRGTKTYIPKFRAGYMRKRGADWVIKPAREINGTTFARLREDNVLFGKLQLVEGCRNAFKVYVRVGRYDFQEVKGGFLRVKAAVASDASEHPRQGLQEATLAKSGPMFSKRSEAVVFPEDSVAPDLPLCDDLVNAYRDQITPEQEDLLGKGGVLRDGQPVFYTLTRSGDVDFFGHCRMLRMPYRQTPHDLTPEWLRRDEDVDLAEAIFGFTKDIDSRQYSDKERHYAGRVTFGDARLSPGQNDIWLSGNPVLTPRILASPKPTTFQHYLVQTQPGKAAPSSGPRRPSPMSDYASLTPGETVIRGHKMYWHKGSPDRKSIESAEKVKESQATTMQPLRAGVTFDFRVHFENLSDIELGALLWVLQIGDDERYRLKVGMGKPLGMGAVKVTPKLCLTDRLARYSALLDGESWAAGLHDEEYNRKKRQDAVAEFERFVIKNINAIGAKRLEDVDRIRQLLSLLSWPGPPPDQTRYMEIERRDPQAKRGKRNEYDGRPVLPHPFEVAGFAGKTVQSAAGPRPPVANTQSAPEGFKRGTVKKWGMGDHASYGFIQPGAGGPDVFVHRNTLPPGVANLDPGETVFYKDKKVANRVTAIELLVNR